MIKTEDSNWKDLVSILVYLALYLSREIIETLLLSLITNVCSVSIGVLYHLL